MRILVIEDDKEIGKLISLYLKRDGFDVMLAEDANRGLKLFYEEKPSLIILDLMLPDFSGYKVLSEIRKESETPVIIVTAKGEEEDKIVGFRKGADDYIVKPFSFKELLERVKAVLRRAGEGEIIKIKNLTVYPKRFKVFLDDRELNLSSLEFKILMALIKKRGRVISREEILNSVYSLFDEPVIDRAVDVHITNLRKKLKDDPKNPKFIETIRGVGYRIIGNEN